MINSPLKWVGGKYSILEKIIPELNVQNKIVEPFMGSIVVSLNVNANEYVLNDYNPDLVNFFQTVMSKPSDVIAYVTPYFGNMNKETFYNLRDKFNSLPINSEERAALFLIMNKFAFNGVCRYNREGKFNVPYSNATSVAVPDLYIIKKKFENKTVKFFNLDFADSMLYKDLKENDVVYFDPPYLPSDDYETNFSDYTGEGFNLEQHEKLVSIAENLYEKGIRVLISNHDTKKIRDLYQNASYIETIQKKRNISAKKENRKTINEVLAVYGKPIKKNSLFE